MHNDDDDDDDDDNDNDDYYDYDCAATFGNKCMTEVAKPVTSS